nr:vegetative cell wall protein gp1-like [Ipomoea batatas]GME21727.1 vegetative cell wall protein gp1-like [Ipomoea batatas]
MANQQQPRPLFRFASMFRPTAPAPAPAPAPQPTRPPAPATATAPQQPVRPPLAAASFRPPAPTTTVPCSGSFSASSSPFTTISAAAATKTRRYTVAAAAVTNSHTFPNYGFRITSSVPTSPVQKPITEFTSYSPKPKVQSPPKPQPFQDYYNPPPKPASPVRAPPPSPKTFEKTPQMSPLKLPKPAQTMSDSDSEPKIPIDQKKMVVQETTQRSRGYIPPIRHHPHENKQNEADEYGMSVLTLAGENKGAIMDLSPARKKYGFNGTPQKLQSDAEKSGSGSDSESRAKYPNGTGRGRGRRSSLPMTAFMNSNVQSINNSILHNTTCNHHDPGIHLIFSGKEGFKPHYPKGSPNTR